MPKKKGYTGGSNFKAKKSKPVKKVTNMKRSGATRKVGKQRKK